jgi:pilus assembly protein CpaB
VRASNLLILTTAVVMGAVAAFMARSFIQGQTRTVSAQTIVVAAVTLDMGVVIPETKVAEVIWSAPTLPEGAFATKEEFYKDGQRYALTQIARNEPVLKTKVATAGQGGLLSSLLDKDKRAVTVRVDDVSGVAGFVQPNSRVDIALIRTGEGNAGSYSNIILENVKVLAIDQLTAATAERAAMVARAVTLEASAEEAQKVLLAEKVGRLSLILRQPGEANGGVGRRITERDLSNIPADPTKTVTPDLSPVVPRTDNTTVIIVRGSKPEEYSVKNALGQ